MKNFIAFSLMLFTACATTSSRQPAQALSLDILRTNYCSHIKSGINRIENAFMVKNINGRFQFAYQYQQANPIDRSEVSCKEDAQGFTCFVPKHNIMRLDFAFMDQRIFEPYPEYPRYQKAIASFSKVKLNTADDYRCWITPEPPTTVFDSYPF